MPPQYTTNLHGEAPVANPGHRCMWARGTKAQVHVGAGACGHVGQRHRCMWAQVHVGTWDGGIGACGHRCMWARGTEVQVHVGTDACGHVGQRHVAPSIHQSVLHQSVSLRLGARGTEAHGSFPLLSGGDAGEFSEGAPKSTLPFISQSVSRPACRGSS